jgi:hypothetical protein
MTILAGIILLFIGVFMACLYPVACVALKEEPYPISLQDEADYERHNAGMEFAIKREKRCKTIWKLLASLSFTAGIAILLIGA